MRYERNNVVLVGVIPFPLDCEAVNIRMLQTQIGGNATHQQADGKRWRKKNPKENVVR